MSDNTNLTSAPYHPVDRHSRPHRWHFWRIAASAASVTRLPYVPIRLARSLLLPCTASKRRSAAVTSMGFTLVELIISISLIGILSVSLLAVITNYLVLMTRNNIVVDMTSDSQNLLRVTVEALRYGAGVRQTNTITDSNAPVGGWNTGNANFVIIIAVPAQDAAGSYIIDSDTGEPYKNELVYYKSGSLLYRRSLANPSAAGNSLITSCPPASATLACPADRTLIDTINTMVFTLYDQDDVVTNDPLLARSVKIDLNLRKDSFGDPLTLDNSIRITLRNSF